MKFSRHENYANLPFAILLLSSHFLHDAKDSCFGIMLKILEPLACSFQVVMWPMSTVKKFSNSETETFEEMQNLRQEKAQNHIVFLA